LLATGLGSLQYVLERGQRLDWFSSDQIVIFTIVSVVAITASRSVNCSIPIRSSTCTFFPRDLSRQRNQNRQRLRPLRNGVDLIAPAGMFELTLQPKSVNQTFALGPGVSRLIALPFAYVNAV